MARKIIQICSDLFDLFALCDDGTVWNLVHGRRWKLLPEIPRDNPSYKAYLDESIDDLRVKDRAGTLSKDEKEELLDLLEQRKKYELYR
ncbi:hypothetical protein QV08_09615 [Gallibacterium salpingitidis]|uniref:hypothetical protein n=1 Tax=Gallibacterium salpingitidis TaxID=505341 RepID=UPI000804AA8B|nr:hypothetical protein [Gallibacterium salpingitidis]OBX06656.1 hypothetical protein QV08_09615 [Gallibacterium salpingitidis]